MGTFSICGKYKKNRSFRTFIMSKYSEKMEKVYKNCQSCGMPLKRDEQGGGTNADG